MQIIEHPIWDTGDSLALPELVGEVRADVCVVGLGGSGLACIRALNAAGVSVVGIDAIAVAAAAAGRNGGFLLGGLAMFHHDAVERLGRRIATAIYEQTLEQVTRMMEETPAAVWRTGSLRIMADEGEAADCAAQYEAMRRDGLAVEQYDGPEGRGLLFPADASFDPALRCVTLATHAMADGTRLFARSPAVCIDEARVVTPRGAVSAPQIVVAVDGGLEAILPELAPRVRSARLQMLATAPAADVHLARPVYTRWGLDYWQQRPNGSIVLGGARDVGGEDEWTCVATPTIEVQAALTALLRERVGTGAPITHRWAATVGYTTTGMPVLEQTRPGVWAIGGYSGTGNVVGGLCGRAVAEMIVSGRSALAELLTS